MRRLDPAGEAAPQRRYWAATGLLERLADRRVEVAFSVGKTRIRTSGCVRVAARVLMECV